MQRAFSFLSAFRREFLDDICESLHVSKGESNVASSALLTRGLLHSCKMPRQLDLRQKLLQLRNRPLTDKILTNVRSRLSISRMTVFEKRYDSRLCFRIV